MKTLERISAQPALKYLAYKIFIKGDDRNNLDEKDKELFKLIFHCPTANDLYDPSNFLADKEPKMLRDLDVYSSLLRTELKEPLDLIRKLMNKEPQLNPWYAIDTLKIVNHQLMGYSLPECDQSNLYFSHLEKLASKDFHKTHALLRGFVSHGIFRKRRENITRKPFEQINIINTSLNTLMPCQKVNFFIKDLFLYACENGFIQLAQFLIEQCSEEKKQAVLSGEGLFRSNKQQICRDEYTFYNPVSLPYSPFISAYEAGSFELIEWLWTQYPENERENILSVDDYRIFQKACENGNFDLVLWLWTQCPEEKRQEMLFANDFEAFNSACKSNNNDIIHFLIREYPEEKKQGMLFCYGQFNAFHSACKNSNRDLMIFLLEQCPEEEKQEMLSEGLDHTWNSIENTEWIWERLGKDKQEEYISESASGFFCLLRNGNKDIIEWIWRKFTEEMKRKILFNRHFKTSDAGTNKDNRVMKWVWQEYKNRGCRDRTYTQYHFNALKSALFFNDTSKTVNWLLKQVPDPTKRRQLEERARQEAQKEHQYMKNRLF